MEHLWGPAFLPDLCVLTRIDLRSFHVARLRTEEMAGLSLSHWRTIWEMWRRLTLFPKDEKVGSFPKSSVPLGSGSADCLTRMALIPVTHRCGNYGFWSGSKFSLPLSSLSVSWCKISPWCQGMGIYFKLAASSQDGQFALEFGLVQFVNLG